MAIVLQPLLLCTPDVSITLRPQRAVHQARLPGLHVDMVEKARAVLSLPGVLETVWNWLCFSQSRKNAQSTRDADSLASRICLTVSPAHSHNRSLVQYACLPAGASPLRASLEKSPHTSATQPLAIDALSPDCFAMSQSRCHPCETRHSP